jgi:hypothetical protein
MLDGSLLESYDDSSVTLDIAHCTGPSSDRKFDTDGVHYRMHKYECVLVPRLEREG